MKGKSPKKPSEEPEDESEEESEDVLEAESEVDLTDEERAVLMEVVRAGDKGVLADQVAKKLKLPVKKVEKILDRFEEEGWFYSEEGAEEKEEEPEEEIEEDLEEDKEAPEKE